MTTNWAHEAKVMAERRRTAEDRQRVHSQAAKIHVANGNLISAAWHSNMAAECLSDATSAKEMEDHARQRMTVTRLVG